MILFGFAFMLCFIMSCFHLSLLRYARQLSVMYKKQISNFQRFGKDNNAVIIDCQTRMTVQFEGEKNVSLEGHQMWGSVEDII